MTRLFYICIILICAVESYNAHLIDIVRDYVNLEWSSLVALELALLSVAANASRGTRKHKSILLVAAMWMVWHLFTDWVPVFPGWLNSYETIAFCVLIGTIAARPERLPSYFGPNVSLAFYSGSQAPIIGHILSLFPLPYSGVALVVDGRMMQPRKKTGKFVRVDLAKVSRNWTLLGTPFETTPEIKSAFNRLEGTPVTMANCVRAIKPALSILGYQSNTPGGLAMEVLNGG